ncbi:S1 family peptidase [Pedobacter sp.]|uniref:S1 family peptidase n=1 Tax=Pedobacter sp. TaxID=1411316 RepID=UPI003BA9248A
MNHKKSCNCSDPEVDLHEAFSQLNNKVDALAGLIKELASPQLESIADVPDFSVLEKLQWIIGGEEVLPGTFPSCCLVGVRSDKGMIWKCSGVLISRELVITAGHCFLPFGEFEVALDVTSLRSIDESERVTVSDAILHPNYNHSSYSNDICLLRLSRPSKTAPVNIATTNEIRASKRIQVVGFGSHSNSGSLGFGIKREVIVPIMSLDREDGTSLQQDSYKFAFNPKTEFVAGGQGFGSCWGDSGGPAYIEVGGELKVAGITSRSASGQSNCTSGAIYIRLDKYQDFIA